MQLELVNFVEITGNFPSKIRTALVSGYVAVFLRFTLRKVVGLKAYVLPYVLILKAGFVLCDQQRNTSTTLSTRKNHMPVCGIMPDMTPDPGLRPPRGEGIFVPFAS